MKKVLTIVFSLLTVVLLGQTPVNDDCGGIIDLGVAPYCPDDEFFTNVNATASDIGFGTNLPCFTNSMAERDVWFQFTAASGITNYEVKVTGMDDGSGSTPISTPQLAVYRGFCIPGELLFLDCIEATPGSNEVSLELPGLTSGLTYFIRVSDHANVGTNSGTFNICIDEKLPDATVDQGSSDQCEGVLYDTGGADGDYGADENHVFTICPTDFNQCIKFSLEYYNIAGDEGDQLVFYDGDNTSAPVLGIFDGGGFFSESDGGVAYEVYASSGCMTIEFTSDEDVQLEGFKGTWSCTPDNCPTIVSIDVDSEADTSLLVDYLNTAFASTTIDTIMCPPGAFGAFIAGDDTDLGLDRGLILTTGEAINAIGPNTSSGTSTGHFADGDPDLDSLSVLLGDGSLSEDACVIELSVFAYTDQLSFEYVFGSEEYKEYVNDAFNDIFAFLISGPGITGLPQLNNQENIAVLPGTNTPTQINSVNHLTNWQYYRDNENGLSTEYDGLTADSLGVKLSLTAEANVIPCNTYKLKLAIADRGDDILDSGVFISEITSGTPDMYVSFNSGIDYLVEECTSVSDELIIEIQGEITGTVTYAVELSGTAQNGLDYQITLPDSLSFSQANKSYSFPISVLDDFIDEGVETIVVSLKNDYGCGEVTLKSLTIEIRDQLNVDIKVAQDSADVCILDGIQLSAEGGQTYLWTPVGILDNPGISNPFATPVTDTWVSVTGYVGACSNQDSIFLSVRDVQVMASAVNPNICLGEQVQLNATANAPNPSYSWSPEFFVSDPSISNPTSNVSFPTDFVVEVEQYGCIARDTVSILVDTLFEPVLIGDTTICLSQSVQLANLNAFGATSTYEWNPSLGLNDATVPNPIATPPVGTTIYTLNTTSANNFCSNTQQVAVTVIDAALDVVEYPSLVDADTISICAPGSTMLLAQNSTNGVGLSWTPSDGSISSLTDSLVTIQPTTEGLYVATIELTGCSLSDSVYIRYDSLPDLAIMAIPIEDPYCPGDTVTLYSENYSQDAYPNISHQWQPASGTISELDKFNLVFITEDTITYTRTTWSGGCVDSASITLNVEQPADITITQDKEEVCAGDPVQLMASSDQGDSFTWNPTTDLSCSDCPNPVSTPSQTITYNVSLTGANCPSSASATITVLSVGGLQFPDDNQLCPGESATLNLTSDPLTSYVWTSTDPNFGTVTDPQPTVTPTQTQTYTVTISNGLCEETHEITIHVADDVLSIEGPDGVCPGFPITLTATTNGSGSFFWSPDGQMTQSIDVQPSVPTTYSVTYNYGDGCTLTAEKDIVIYQDYSIFLESEKDTVFAGEVLSVLATISPTIQNPEINWTQNGEPVTGSTTILNTHATQGPIDVIQATLVSPDGCIFTGEISMVVLPVRYDIPNAFTPNGDGQNDHFRPAFLDGYSYHSMKVFSRWGQMVFDDTNPQGWDGTFKGKDLPSDAYPFQIQLTHPNGQTVFVKGNVSLLR